ncbi:uncharacterized protein LOC141853943 [Brevipalpus obovatus]|uniref:uncharacterized protein LOC141853943 n=1 Tax=Brevipalpus obovatus TaxID=246614 RepID=UPI003D9F2E1D
MMPTDDDDDRPQSLRLNSPGTLITTTTTTTTATTTTTTDDDAEEGEIIDDDDDDVPSSTTVKCDQTGEATPNSQNKSQSSSNTGSSGGSIATNTINNSSSSKVNTSSLGSSAASSVPNVSAGGITSSKSSASSSSFHSKSASSRSSERSRDHDDSNRRTRREADRSSISPRRRSSGDRKGRNSQEKEDSKSNRKRRRGDKSDTERDKNNDDGKSSTKEGSVSADENGLRPTKHRKQQHSRMESNHIGGDSRNSPYYNSGSSDSGDDSDGSDDGDEDDFDLNEEMWMNMLKHMQEMMKIAKEKGNKKKKEKMELMMKKMMESQADLNSREMREMLLKNRRLFRSPSFRDRELRDRDRSFPIRFRDARRGRGRPMDRRRNARERRMAERERFRIERDKDRDAGIRERLSKTACKFYLEGKCHKGHDCPFSHETPMMNKKKDICKFYLQGFCGKGDSCLFMHGEFPCKFYHTGAECYSGANCRFSHQPLTDETRQLLKNYLDSGELPDEINQTDKDKSGPRKPPILGDPTEEMRTSYSTWLWQKEMKELELAYKGTKRNLFCVDEQFVIKEKPEPKPGELETPQASSSSTTKVMSFYMDTMGDTSMAPVDNSGPPISEDDRLIEMSFHDEDLRLAPSSGPPAIGAVFGLPTPETTDDMSSNKPEMGPKGFHALLTQSVGGDVHMNPQNPAIDVTSYPFSGPGPGMEHPNQPNNNLPTSATIVDPRLKASSDNSKAKHMTDVKPNDHSVPLIPTQLNQNPLAHPSHSSLINNNTSVNNSASAPFTSTSSSTISPASGALSAAAISSGQNNPALPGSQSLSQSVVDQQNPGASSDSLSSATNQFFQQMSHLLKKPPLNDSSESGSELYINEFGNEKEKGTISIPPVPGTIKKKDDNNSDDSDDDTEYEPLKAALKNLGQSSSMDSTNTNNSNANKKPGKPKIDIAKMLNVIRQTSSQINPVDSSSSSSALNPSSTSTATTGSLQHANFWQNILGGTSLISSPSQSGINLGDSLSSLKRRGSDSSGEYKDARGIKREPDTGGQAAASYGEYKLFPMDAHRIDYSSYEYLYRNDMKLRSDPRLQNYFREKYPLNSSSL